jgi:dCMP deaminase
MQEEINRPPEPNEYFMGIAIAVRERANCLGSRIGAVIVRDGRIISTGYNGTPEGMRNCLDGGCHRCSNRGKEFQSGEAYDVCICVHGEQNAILSAARFGIAVEGSSLYTTTRPCFGCSKEILQAKIKCVFYIHEWLPANPKTHSEYKRIQTELDIRRLNILDPRRDWAAPKRASTATPAIDEHGAQEM